MWLAPHAPSPACYHRGPGVPPPIRRRWSTGGVMARVRGRPGSVTDLDRAERADRAHFNSQLGCLGLLGRLLSALFGDPRHPNREIRSLRAGAHGETRVAEELARLSDDYWVFHDVRLRARTPIKFDGKGLFSAQVDHLVVGPTGVFVIESKCWSSDHAAKEDDFSPFDQVRRAGYLCYRLLKVNVQDTKVQQLLVPVGAPLKPINAHHVHLVWPSRVARWIEGGRDQLSPDRVDAIARYLTGLVAPTGGA